MSQAPPKPAASGTPQTDFIRSLTFGLLLATICLQVLSRAGMPLWLPMLTAGTAAACLLWLVRALGPAPSIWVQFPRNATKLIGIVLLISIMWWEAFPLWWFPFPAILLAAWLGMIRPWRAGVLERPDVSPWPDEPRGGGSEPGSHDGGWEGGGDFGGGGASDSGWGDFSGLDGDGDGGDGGDGGD